MVDRDDRRMRCNASTGHGRRVGYCRRCRQGIRDACHGGRNTSSSFHSKSCAQLCIVDGEYTQKVVAVWAGLASCFGARTLEDTAGLVVQVCALSHITPSKSRLRHSGPGTPGTRHCQPALRQPAIVKGPRLTRTTEPPILKRTGIGLRPYAFRRRTP